MFMFVIIATKSCRSKTNLNKQHFANDIKNNTFRISTKHQNYRRMLPEYFCENEMECAINILQKYVLTEIFRHLNCAI